MRVWATTYVIWAAQLLAKLSMGRASRAARDWALDRQAKRMQQSEIIWDTDPVPADPVPAATVPLRAAE